MVDEGLKKRFGAFKTPQNKPYRMIQCKVQRGSMERVRHAEPGFRLQVVGQRRSAHIFLAFPLGEGGPLAVDEGLKNDLGLLEHLKTSRIE